MKNFEKAQNYELNYATKVINEDFKSIYLKWLDCKNQGSLWQDEHNQWFQGDKESWNQFVEWVKDKKCLEIGSGPFGFLAPCHWIKDRVIIEPLVDEYRRIQLSLGGTFFTPDIKTYNQKAETIIEDLVGKVNGFIVCRNALDHCESPMIVLHNITKYATKGCYFLLWTDIWHKDGVDEGHSNITTSTEELDKMMLNYEFSIIKYGARIRNPEHFIEYGRLFKKV